VVCYKKNVLLCFAILSTIADEKFMLNNIDYIFSRFIVILLLHDINFVLAAAQNVENQLFVASVDSLPD